jgi:SAM-dependent methyltransferase
LSAVPRAGFAKLRRLSDPEQRRYERDERLFDHDLGIRTFDSLDPAQFGAVGPHAKTRFYAPTARAGLDRIFESIRRLPMEAFTFVDLGSGMGRVVLFASQFPFREVVGVEFSPAFHAIAEQNLLTYRAPRKTLSVRLLHADATEYAFPPTPLVLYIYNAFDRTVLKKIVENLETSLRETPRDVVVYYIYPVERHILDASSLLKFKGGWASPHEDRGANSSCAVYANFEV